MDKLSVISGALFFAADLFAIASLAMPNWIVSDVGGKSHLDLSYYFQLKLWNLSDYLSCITV